MLVFTDIDALNDDFFNHKRHRTSAISESVASIANYPTKLRIYLTNASPYWQVRCFIKGRTYTKSLRTTSRRVAVRGAKDFFHRTVRAGCSNTTILPYFHTETPQARSHPLKLKNKSRLCLTLVIELT